MAVLGTFGFSVVGVDTYLFNFSGATAVPIGMNIRGFHNESLKRHLQQG